MSEQQDCDDVVKALYEKHQKEVEQIIAKGTMADAFLGLFRLGYRLDHISPHNRLDMCPDCGGKMLRAGTFLSCLRCRVTWVRAIPVAKTQKPMITEEEYRTDGF